MPELDALPLLEQEPFRLLAEASLNAREEEARRIARELHDDAGQLFAWAFLALAEVAAEAPPPARARLDEVRDHLRALEVRLQRLAHELRPRILDELGLAPGVEFLAETVAARTGIHVSVHASDLGRFPPAVEIAAYRIVQEALTNVTKHARARAASVQLLCPASSLGIIVRDDGVGFDADGGACDRGFSKPGALAFDRGLGLLGIRERLVPFGGKLLVRSAPGCGTELEAEIPLDETPWSAVSS